MVATPAPRVPYVPWYRRWDIPIMAPALLLTILMFVCVNQSIATSGWASGLNVLLGVALPALLIGVLFARLHWLSGWLAHPLSAALGIAWAIEPIGPLLVDEIAGELGRSQADRLSSWGDWATEILIRVLMLFRIVQAGGRGEDIVLFIVALALLVWALGYITAWLLFHAGWTWWAIILNAVTILINYTFASPKPNTLFFIFLAAALLLLVHQHVVHQQMAWQSSLVEYPAFLALRFLMAATLVCGALLLLTSFLPNQVSSDQVSAVWLVISSPFTAAREGWEQAFSTINAPPGTSGTGFVSRSVQVGGGRSLGDAVVLRVRSPVYDYW